MNKDQFMYYIRDENLRWGPHTLSSSAHVGQRPAPKRQISAQVTPRTPQQYSTYTPNP